MHWGDTSETTIMFRTGAIGQYLGKTLSRSNEMLSFIEAPKISILRVRHSFAWPTMLAKGMQEAVSGKKLEKKLFQNTHFPPH